jgi:hypothetical protein
VKGVDSAVDWGSCPKELLAGADAGVPAVPNRFGGGAVVVVLAPNCAFEAEPNMLFDGAVAVAVAFSKLCALVPNMLFCGVSCWGALALAPKPLKMPFCAGAAFCVLKPPNMLLVAGVPGACAPELAPPKVKGVDWAMGVPATCALEVGAPNAKDVDAAAGVPTVCVLEVGAPNVKGVGAAAGVLIGAADAPNIFVGGALLVMVPNMPPVLGALLVLVPNRLPVLAALVVFICAGPPKGLFGGCELNREPPKAGAAPLPFPFIAAELVEAKGFEGVAAPAVKLKPSAAGGWGLKPVVWLLAPNAGNDELEKVLLGAADWAGGKLFVAPPPNALVVAPNMPLVLLLPPTAGADAPKLKLGWEAPKFALCEGAWTRMLANCARSFRLPSTVRKFFARFDMARVAMADAAGGWVDGGTHCSSSCWAAHFGSLDPGNKRSANAEQAILCCRAPRKA